ncbi:MAG: hypothetical protein HYU36_10290 [Planctomycetes bacterium]|nr:hypothetical protein [Planctomycetota bacterium]
MNSALNSIFRPSKSRRLVSAWMVRESVPAALVNVREFHDLFDQIILMCGSFQADGSLPRQWPVEGRRALAAELRGLGISVLLDYSGPWEGAGMALARTPGIASSWIARMLEECNEVGADGVDLDIEGWPPEGRFPYARLVREASEALHERHLMLSVCVGALSPEARRENGIGFQDTSVLAHHADHLRAMVYDLYCPPSLFIGPTSTAPWGRETMAYLASQAPRHKIVMGLPTYSVDWNITDPAQSTQVNDFRWIAEREKESPIGRGWCYYWDVSLIRYTDARGHAHLLWVSDARSTRSHLRTVETLDLAGVCFWVLGGEDPAIWQALRETLRRK